VAEEYLTRREVAELLKVPVKTVDYWIATKEIPYSRPAGRTVRFIRSRIEEHMRSREGVEFRLGRKGKAGNGAGKVDS
jgi:excisionase family DNA binding protein